MDFIEPCFGIGHNLSLICQMTSEDIKHQLIIITFYVFGSCFRTLAVFLFQIFLGQNVNKTLGCEVPSVMATCLIISRWSATGHRLGLGQGFLFVGVAGLPGWGSSTVLSLPILNSADHFLYFLYLGLRPSP